jgi:serine/threonine protein kinase
LAAFLSEERNESYLLLKDAGTNLHAMRERGEVSPKDIRRYARVVLNALAHVHKHGVVHRDVKGGNVLVADTPGYSDSPSHDKFVPSRDADRLRRGEA